MNAHAPHLARLRQRARVMQALRAWFDAAGFVEVDTYLAVTAPAPELHIEAPEVLLQTSPLGTPPAHTKRFLQTSPELPMKRLLAMGMEKIYQVAPVFRDGDLSPLHRPEFRLLEWYRRDAPWATLLSDCEGLLARCAEAAGREGAFSHNGHAVDLTRPFRRITMDEAFQRHAGFSILDALTDPSLRRALDAQNIPHRPDDTWDDLFNRIFLERVEPALCREPGPFFLTHFPAPLASLARLDPKDSRVSERFELYAGAMELANGFGELTDAAVQRQRFVEEAKARHIAGRRAYPLDERFLDALKAVPAAAGIAVGMERLLMLLLDTTDLDAVVPLPWSET